jgi:hypothetical protein
MVKAAQPYACATHIAHFSRAKVTRMRAEMSTLRDAIGTLRSELDAPREELGA